ncbi:MAG: 3'-5' exonuclease [Eubacteriales bacterium]|nr:3'-5' exonuclease [Eubacteriales bacterium]
MKQNKTFRPIPGLSREEEEAQLAEILGVAQENLVRTEGYIRQLSEELYDLMETYGPKDKEALALLHNTQSQLRENQRDLLRCRKARKKPYFGRIDFRDPNQPKDESYYVGRVGISRNGSEPLVIDWRAPVASVYYENVMGPCRYVVKNEGTCEIDLKRKRTYEIAEDKLKDFFDSDVVANDELLTKYLAKSKKAVLGEIIATIQKEQNAIIRKSPKTNLIVQGVAGSGKTTVAMHRISYILYNYEEEFRPEDFYIIGSNRILLNYITSVLPDLDVYGVAQMTMEQLFVRLLYEDWDADAYRICPIDKKNPDSCMKGSYEWFHDLEAFCRDYEKAAIPQEEVRVEKNGALLVGEATIRNYVEKNPQISMQSKINMLNEILLSKLENELTGKYVSYTPEEKKELFRACRWHFGKEEWKGSIFEVYREFLNAQAKKGKTIPFPENAFDVYDLAALAYLYKRIKETDGIREASHVIIDEAQDFGMMAYGALAYCLRGCTYTIMGDVSQNIHFGYGLNEWKELQELILTGTFDSFGLLKKSYRNTVEISDFATEILRHGNFPIYPVEPISRHGNAVRLAACADEEAMLRETERTIEAWMKEGRETIAVICRDEAEAAAVSERLGERLELADSNLETTEFGSGIMVLPVEYTKGLEFDAVLLYNASEAHYPEGDSHVKLLYVAATRALHELTVVHRGDLTGLIGKPVSEEKRMRSLENEVPKETVWYKQREITAREQEIEDARQGEKERALRGYLGPKPIEVKKVRPEDDAWRLAAGPGRNGVQGGSRAAAGLGQNGDLSGSRAAESGLGRNGSQDGDRAKKSGPGLGQNGGLGSSPNRPQSAGAQRIISRRAPVRSAEAQDNVPLNESPFKFGEIPDSSLLRPQGHSRIDNAVRMAKKTKKYIDLISNYGTLRLTPLEAGILRVQFVKGRLTEFEPGYWNYQPETPVSWTAKEGKNLLEIGTELLTVRIEKKSGALQFYEKTGRLLLAEKAALPRQMETLPTSRTWVYFDWPKTEKLSAKGKMPEDLERIDHKARYISFGGRRMRMPLLLSEYGYGIGVAAEKTVMCCAVPMYGQYLYADGTNQIDYYFLYGGTYEKTLELYQKL